MSDESAEVTSRAELPEEMQGIVDIDTLRTDKYHYRFVQERPQNMARKRAKGYEPVNGLEEGVELLTGEVAADGLIRDGDTVLMRVEKARFKKKRQQLRELTEARLSTPVQHFKQKTKGKGPGGKDILVDTNETDKEI